MKKMLNILFYLMIMIQMFNFAMPVMADEKEKIEILSLKQGDIELVQDDDGVYQVDGIDEIFLEYKFNNVDNLIKSDEYYTIGGMSIRSTINTSGKNLLEKKFNTLVYLSPYEELTNCQIVLYDNNYEEIAVKEFKLKFNLYEEYSTKYREMIFDYSDLFSVRQGGVELIQDENGKYNVNDIEDIEIYLHKNDLFENLNYVFIVNGNNYEFANIDEEEMLVEKYSINELKDSYNDIELGIKTKIFDGLINVYYFSYYEDNDIENFEFKLGYTNYIDKDIEISQVASNENSKYYVISPKYHNDNNTLSLIVDGNNYLNKDYDVNIEIIKNDNVVYTKQYVVNGLLLNDKYNIKIDDFASKLATSYEDLSLYEVRLQIGNKTDILTYKYSQGKGDIAVGASLFYEDGKLNLFSFAGSGEVFYTGRQYQSNVAAFEKFSNMYISFLGQNFDSNEIYDYELSYAGDWNDYFFEINQNYQVIKTGNVSGLRLNTIGLVLPIDNRNNYEYPEYRLTIRKNNEIIHYSVVSMRVTNNELIANIGLVANNKNLYLRTLGDIRHIDNSYIATRNYPLTMAITGVGYDDDKEYSINYIVYGQNDKDAVEVGSTVLDSKELKFSGKELNTGNAKIIFDKEISNDIESASFVIMGDGGQGAFYVEYVDVMDLFSKVGDYIIDNTVDLIKNIKKQTSVDEIKNNLEVTDDGSIKIYDKNGVEEIDGSVGTGMIARIVDEYDRSLLDMDVVVKGDTTGDGNISITDLIKVRQHLANINKLDGLYEMAGDTTDKGNISITDLIKIRQDLAKIQELG